MREEQERHMARHSGPSQERVLGSAFRHLAEQRAPLLGGSLPRPLSRPRSLLLVVRLSLDKCQLPASFGCLDPVCGINRILWGGVCKPE